MRRCGSRDKEIKEKLDSHELIMIMQSNGFLKLLNKNQDIKIFYQRDQINVLVLKVLKCILLKNLYLFKNYTIFM
ncbi:unnamed protein product [Paramecium primaurelia]|uniref:Uncharacterized protein n=1 Tax=Paramecium primaurelia TaxID=5886 RepID=A0A8S1LXT0_PARPR|nr:unnamed protein product [Paramecium primaurelia]